MFKDITIGQYIRMDSVIHKLDARLKILLTFAYIILLFIISKPLAYIFFCLATFTVIKMSKIPFKYILKGIRPMVFIIVFTVIINLFLTNGDILWSTSVFSHTLKITYQGVNMGILIFFRLVLLIMGTSLLTLTTSPMMLTDGMESLLRPFNIVKVPSHEIAMMMSIAIRFIPTLAEETDKIMKAQTARGADFESGNIIMRAKAMIPILIPLFVSAFRRADELATAMDARCYNGGKHRTRLKQMKMGKRDFIAIACFVVFSAVLIILQIV